MAQVNWTKPALDDLEEILSYIGMEDRGLAQEIAAEAFGKADDRGFFPEVGAIVPETDNPQIREILVRKAFRLIYEIRGGQVFVLAFVRSKRKISRSFLSGRQ